MALAAFANFPDAIFADGQALARLKQDDAAKTKFEQFVKMRPADDLNRQRALRFIRRFTVVVAAIATVMLAASAYSGLVVAARIAEIQASIGAAPSSLPAGDARRVEFGRLHGLSTALELIPVLGGLVLIFWEMKE